MSDENILKRLKEIKNLIRIIMEYNKYYCIKVRSEGLSREEQEKYVSNIRKIINLEEEHFTLSRQLQQYKDSVQIIENLATLIHDKGE